MKSNFYIWRRNIFIVLILLTILFIFIQSMLSKEASESESDSVGEVIVDTAETVIGNETEAQKNAVESVRVFVDKHLRKLAHFAEYALLGAEVFLLFYFEINKSGKNKFAPPLGIKALLISLLFSFLIAFTDETIQLISNRGAAILDVWIDMSGYASATLLFFCIFLFAGKKKEA